MKMQAECNITNTEKMKEKSRENAKEFNLESGYLSTSTTFT